jgi:hypothetical protein
MQLWVELWVGFFSGFRMGPILPMRAVFGYLLICRLRTPNQVRKT